MTCNMKVPDFGMTRVTTSPAQPKAGRQDPSGRDKWGALGNGVVLQEDPSMFGMHF